ncbi:MAG: tail fiber domain-containing protein [Rhodoglobus sp.]
MANPTPSSSDFFHRLQDVERTLNDRINRISTFDGSQYVRAVEKLQQLIDDLPGMVDDVLAVEVNTGSVNATGSVTASGNVNAGGSVSGSNLSTANGPTTFHTGPRVAAWLLNAGGLVGTASSRRFKTNIRGAAIDPAAVLGVEVKHYQYLAEIDKRDNPENPLHDPEYHVATEVGMIAEELHDAGLWQFVFYERDADGVLVLDEEGEAIPFGVHYELLAMALLPVAQQQERRLSDLAARVSAMDGQSEASA